MKIISRFPVVRSLINSGVLIAALVSPKAYGAISLSLSGTSEASHQGQVSSREVAGSLRVGLGLGEHFQIGLSHRRSEERTTTLTTENFELKSKLGVVTNGLDLTVILYNGLVSPYLFGGVAVKDYSIESNYSEPAEVNGVYAPMYGLGMQIFLNQDFSLKLNQTFTPSERIVGYADGKPIKKDILDSYLEVGITYRLR
jgi:hypothetical protein